MAPAQIEKRAKDNRTDIFGLAWCVPMVTGWPAFLGNDQGSLSQSILNDAPGPLHTTRRKFRRLSTSFSPAAWPKTPGAIAVDL